MLITFTLYQTDDFLNVNKQTSKQTKQFKTHTDISCFQLAATAFNFSMECTYCSLKINF